MGDVNRKMTTRTLQRPLRPDSETRDPTGGVTDRRDMMFTISRAGDRPEIAPVLTSDLWIFTFTQTEQTSMIPERTETSMFNADSEAFLLEATLALRPSLQEVSVAFARLRADIIANGDWQDQSYWRKAGGRGRDRWQWERESFSLLPNESWERDAAAAGSQEYRRAAEGSSDGSSSKANWNELIGDGRNLRGPRSRSRRTPSSAESGAERPSSRGRGVTDRPGSADPGSRSGSCGTHEGGHRHPHGQETRQGKRTRTMARSGPPGDGRVTSLRDSLQDPKRMVRRELYEEG